MGLTNLVNTVRDISHLKKGHSDIENEALKNFSSYDELAEYCIAFNDSDLCLAFLLEKSRGYKAVKTSRRRVSLYKSRCIYNNCS